MKRYSKQITLALVGAALIVFLCKQKMMETQNSSYNSSPGTEPHCLKDNSNSVINFAAFVDPLIVAQNDPKIRQLEFRTVVVSNREIDSILGIIEIDLPGEESCTGPSTSRYPYPSATSFEYQSQSASGDRNCYNQIAHYFVFEVELNDGKKIARYRTGDYRYNGGDINSVWQTQNDSRDMLSRLQSVVNIAYKVRDRCN